MSAGVCTFCGNEVSANDDYRKVEGWERRRAAGGANTITLREPKDEWACKSCIDKLNRGISLDQGSLL